MAISTNTTVASARALRGLAGAFPPSVAASTTEALQRVYGPLLNASHRLDRLRDALERQVEETIALLDALDAIDDGLEDDGEAGSPHRLGYGGDFDGSEAEPSLGAVEPCAWLLGCHWQGSGGATSDIEDDPAESGIGDHDGLTEQMMRHHGVVADAEVVNV